MRISDWSSDVCSSDLVHRQAEPAVQKNKIALQVVGSLVVGSLVVGLLLVGFQYMISSFRQDIDKSLNPSCLVQLLAETNSRTFKKRVTHNNKFLPSGLLKDDRYLGRLLAIISGVVQLVRDLNQIRLLINHQKLKNNLELVTQSLP